MGRRRAQGVRPPVPRDITLGPRAWVQETKLRCHRFGSFYSSSWVPKALKRFIKLVVLWTSGVSDLAHRSLFPG